MTMASDSAENVLHSKKPSDSAFKQQRLPAWQPILTAGTVLPTFFVIGIAFIPVGIALLYFSDEVKEHIIDYTFCKPADSSRTCSEIIGNDHTIKNCTCILPFELDVNFNGKVYMYYGLSNYYQNHRRYVKSRDDNQLLGVLSLEPSSDCQPYAYHSESGGPDKPVAPCGAIANSLFNDKLKLYNRNNDPAEREDGKVPLLKTGIAWESDKKIKFRNPEGDLKVAFKDYTKPKDWDKAIWELDLKDEDNNGFQNEDLIVWMRTAALPTFRKLYRRIDHSVEGYLNGLPAGKYELEVVYKYDVSSFEGTKRMILSTTSLLGGKNPFLGIAYIVVGCVCLLLGIALLFIHIKCGKSSSEMITVNTRTLFQ